LAALHRRILHPRVVAALEAQLQRRRAVLERGARHVGWKIGGDIPEVDEISGGMPAIGYLTSASLLPGGGVYRGSAAAGLHADTEVVIQLGRDVDVAADAAAAIAGLAVGLEVVDLGRPPGDLEGIIAANVFHRAFALGEPTPVTLPLDAEARSVMNGQIRETGSVRGDYAETVRMVARLLGAVDERLRAGDLILSGSVTQVGVAAGDKVRAEIDGLGSVALTVEP
jgi:2-keto-4-pentenoate hydratase